MRFLATGLLLVAVAGIFVGSARGDGRFFVSETVPPGVPYQRAFLISRNNSEPLILRRMRQDLAFAPASDKEPYRERQIVW